MRGDPEFDEQINKLYRQERKKELRSLKLLRIVVCLLGIITVVLLYTWNYRPTRVAVLPFILGLGLLKFFDPQWNSLNVRFTYLYVGLCAAFYFLRFVLILEN